MIKKLIENFKNIKIAVIGDLMLDEYIMGKVERISPEAPVPVVKVTEEKFVLGGAANVINNLAALGANVYCGGLVGKDKNAEKLINAFPKNVDCNLILKVENRPTIVKKRVIAGHQQLLRLDWEEEFYINEDEENIIIKNLKNHIKELNAVILSDYNKGLLTKSLSQKIINLCRENNVIVTVDPKPKNITNFVGASSITPNKKEAYLAVDANSREDIDIVGIVDSKRLVAQNRLWRGNRQRYATTLHRSLQSQIKSGLPFVVKDSSMGLQAMFVQHATQIAVIRIGVLRAVVHCHGIIKLPAHAGENRSDAVEMYFVIYERVDIYPPVDSLCRRRCPVNISLPEGITILCKQTAEEIVRATAKRKMPCKEAACRYVWEYSPLASVMD